jgi:hypothetical protein
MCVCAFVVRLMLLESSQKVTTKRWRGREPRVPYLRAAARVLGCSSGHLWHVVVGIRTSPRLLERYRAWVATLPQTPAQAPE